MKNQCRLCCKKNATTNIFQKVLGDIEISAKILYCCVNINVKDGDGLPSHICNSCAKQLTSCYQFVLKCEESDKKLRAQIVAVIPPVTMEVCIPKVEVKLETDNSDDDHDVHKEYHVPLELVQQKDFCIKLEGNETIEHKKPCKKQSKYTESCTCSVCGRKCANPSSYKIHMRSHTNEKPYQCPSCDKRYKERGILKRHIDKHHLQIKRQRDYICETCGKGFYSKHDVTVHIRSHTGETPYKCSVCAQRFTQISALLRHVKRHNNDKPHQCLTCPKKFCTKEELKMHLVAHTTEKNYSCSVCNVRFKYQGSLKKHLRWHSEPKRFVCNHCGRMFNMKGNLKCHIDKQHSEKSGHCNVCFKNVANIEAHMWRHNGHRPLKCELCTSSFYDFKGLGHHMNFKHKKTDRYMCEVEGCLMGFPSRPMLDYHTAKLHSTQPPFPCDRCNRAFYRKNDLARHKIGTHKERLL